MGTSDFHFVHLEPETSVGLGRGDILNQKLHLCAAVLVVLLNITLRTLGSSSAPEKKALGMKARSGYDANNARRLTPTEEG